MAGIPDIFPGSWGSCYDPTLLLLTLNLIRHLSEINSCPCTVQGALGLAGCIGQHVSFTNGRHCKLDQDTSSTNHRATGRTEVHVDVDGNTEQGFGARQNAVNM